MSTSKGKKPISTLERIMRSIRHQDECWLWGAGSTHGYSKIELDSAMKKELGLKFITVHRAMYILKNGPIPVDFTIDHLCRVKNCVNPDHLEAVTQAENTRRADIHFGIRSAKIYCPQGHEYTPENTNVNKKTNRRTCLTCHRVHQLAYVSRLATRRLSSVLQ